MCALVPWQMTDWAYQTLPCYGNNETGNNNEPWLQCHKWHLKERERGGGEGEERECHAIKSG